MANQKIKKIIKELQGASKMHLKQSKQLASMAKKASPFKQRSPLLVDTCWDGYHAEGKKKSPSNKKTSGGTIKMVNNCVKN
tara:strand:- start:266 stop:508 length:243 start_codon:yes stop_codon:yes gene_type:complete